MAEQGFTISSPAFTEGGIIPLKHTCDGEDISPELSWMHPPEAARSFGLIVDDPDAPRGIFTHWVLFDIPADVEQLPAKASGIGKGGRNDFHHEKYGGPCPPPNHGEHRYFFKLFALDVPSLDLQVGAAREDVEQAMQGHILDQAELMGRYERTAG